MLRSDIPKDLDFYFDLKVCMLVLIGVMFFFYSSGQNTSLYIDACKSYIVEEVNYVTGEQSNKLGQVMDYQRKINERDFKIPYYMLFNYWVVMPFIDLCFLIYWFYRGEILTPKSLYSRLTSKNRVI